MASIRLQGVEKVYPNGHVAVRHLDLDVADGEFLVLVGPSGCGKSTTLRMIAGLETPTRGRIFLGDQDVTSLPPQQRDLAMVFQNYALYPHKTILQNLEFGLRMRRTDKAVIAERVARVAQVLGIGPLLGRKPSELSGGQRQRVALGRAMVREPRAFLFDEPLSNLDAQLRVQTRAELARMHRQLGATMIYVTHDQEEAMTLGDRIALLHEGRIQQLAAPMDIYLKPANTFVARFIGSPAMNFFRGTTSQGSIRPAGFAVNVDAIPSDLQVDLGVRPQDIQLAQDQSPDVMARVDVIQPLGSDWVVHLELGDARAPATMVVSAESKLRVDDRVGIRFRRDRLHVFDANSGERIVIPG